MNSKRVFVNCTKEVYSSSVKNLTLEPSLFILNSVITKIPEMKFGHQFYTLQILQESKKQSSHALPALVAFTRKQTHLLFIQATTKTKIIHIFNDRRVDGIALTNTTLPKIFTKKFFQNLQSRNMFVLLDLTPFFQKKKFEELKFLFTILRNVIASKVGIMLTNSPTKWSELRNYRGLMSLAELIGISKEKARIKPILKKLHENARKLSENLFFDGIEIIEDKNENSEI